MRGAGGRGNAVPGRDRLFVVGNAGKVVATAAGEQVSAAGIGALPGCQCARDRCFQPRHGATGGSESVPSGLILPARCAADSPARPAGAAGGYRAAGAAFRAGELRDEWSEEESLDAGGGADTGELQLAREYPGAP